MPDPTFPSEAHHYSTCACPNLRCASRGPRGTSNIAHRSWTGKDKHIERLRCKACEQEFSERRGTLMEGTKLPEETVERLLKCQRWGVCDAGTADICGVDIKTVHRFQHVATQRAQEHHEQITCDLQVEAVQLDEMHSKRRGPHVKWLHTAIAMGSRFVLWVHWEPRTQESAALLIAQLVARLCGLPSAAVVAAAGATQSRAWCPREPSHPTETIVSDFVAWAALCKNEVGLCPRFWKLKPEWQEGTILHELFHLCFGLTCVWFQQDQKETTRNSAYCYETFALRIDNKAL